MEPTPPTPWAARDLREIVEVGLHHEGHLLTAGERVVAERIRGLPDDALELYARLLSRVGPVFRVSRLDYGLDAAAAVATLVDAGLVHDRLPDDRCLSAFDKPALQAACRRLGLPVGGGREEVAARLVGRRWVDEPVVMPGHAALVGRLERFCFQRAWVDRRVLVLERLGAVRWATYTPTGGAGLFEDRRAMRAWEGAGRWTDPAEPRALALAGPAPEGRLSPWRAAVEAVLASDPDVATLEALLSVGAPVLPALVRALERAGRVGEAVDRCRAAVGAAGAGGPLTEVAVALARTGGRLARKLGRSFPPLPMGEAPTRVLRLPKVEGGARPGWKVGEHAPAVESAVLHLLALAGREAVFAENSLWTSLYALTFRDLYFLPVPGMLPTSRRDGPLDVGTPAFAQRRAEAVASRLRAVAAEGCAPWTSGWQGERLRGLSRGPEVQRLAPHIPGPMAAAVLARLAREGWSAGAGLPDLLVFSGAPAPLGAALPAMLPESAFLAEIKGEGDTLRDGQRVWLDRLLREGICVEIWSVRNTS